MGPERWGQVERREVRCVVGCCELGGGEEGNPEARRNWYHIEAKKNNNTKKKKKKKERRNRRKKVVFDMSGFAPRQSKMLVAWGLPELRPVFWWGRRMAHNMC